MGNTSSCVGAGSKSSKGNISSQLEKIAKQQGGDESLRKMIRAQLSSYSSRSKVELALDNAWLQQQNIRQQRLLQSLRNEVEQLKIGAIEQSLPGPGVGAGTRPGSGYTAPPPDLVVGGGGGGGRGMGEQKQGRPTPPQQRQQSRQQQQPKAHMHEKRAVVKMMASARPAAEGSYEEEEDQESDYDSQVEPQIPPGTTTRQADERLKRGHACFEKFVNLKFEGKEEEADGEMLNAKLHTYQVIKWCESVVADRSRAPAELQEWHYVRARALRNMGVFYAEQTFKIRTGIRYLEKAAEILRNRPTNTANRKVDSRSKDRELRISKVGGKGRHGSSTSSTCPAPFLSVDCLPGPRFSLISRLTSCRSSSPHCVFSLLCLPPSGH